MSALPKAWESRSLSPYVNPTPKAHDHAPDLPVRAPLRPVNLARHPGRHSKSRSERTTPNRVTIIAKRGYIRRP